MNRNSMFAAGVVGLVVSLLGAEPPEAEPTWFKGNTHSHTLWSDGDGPPELVADWYKEHGYHFLVLSDHNILSVGEKWFDISDTGRLSPQRVQALREQFGESWVSERAIDGKRQMKLKTLSELRERFEETGRFLFIQGEEITDKFRMAEVHINGMHLDEVIPPQGGNDVRETIQNNLNAVIAQGKRLGRPTLAHLNHPNFRWSLTPNDLAAIEGERFFEVYNGHSGVRNYGNHERPSTEAMWDAALTTRLTALDLPILFGLATDDGHEYYNYGVGHTNPGRGWIMVRAKALTPEAILNAMNAGEFYSSSGVELEDVRTSDTSYEVIVRAKPDVTYTIQFIGTRRQQTGELKPGEVLAEHTGTQAAYDYTGDELYVRAKITASTPHPNPYAEGDHECAWTQPVAVARKKRVEEAQEGSD